ncbi:hypothetical protein J6W34_04715 [bacterium]|nr:hypothetical protein [bacterium]
MTNQEKINSIISKLHDYYNNNHLEESHIRDNQLFMKFFTVHNSELILVVDFSDYKHTEKQIEIDLTMMKIFKIYENPEALDNLLFEIPICITNRPTFSYINHISDKYFVEDVFENIKTSFREYNMQINARIRKVRNLLTNQISDETERLFDIFTDKDIKK